MKKSSKDKGEKIEEIPLVINKLNSKNNMKDKKKKELLRRLKIANTPMMIRPPKKIKTEGLLQYSISGLTLVRLDEVIKLVKEIL